MIPIASNNLLKQLDNPWLRNQVETHLFFGSYKWKYLYLLGVVIYAVVCFEFLAPNHDLYSLNIFQWPHSWFVIALITASLFYQYEISAFLLSSIKVSLFFICFLFILGGIVNTLSGQEYSWLLIIIGIIWYPSIEFIKKVTPHQKYITLARILLTVPMVCIIK